MPPRVLVVDDSREMVQGLLDSFLDHGFFARSASDGAAALEALRRGPFDVVLTDMDMPGMDGLELTRAVRREFPAVKVILMTGADMEDHVQEALREGAERVLYKGRFRLRELIEALS